jgi:hypothetical protein
MRLPNEFRSYCRAKVRVRNSDVLTIGPLDPFVLRFRALSEPRSVVPCVTRSSAALKGRQKIVLRNGAGARRLERL